MRIPSDVLEFSAMDDEGLLRVLREYSIGLTVKEARRIEEFLGRPPTIVEAVIWGIQGSEHCSYKSSKHFLRSLPMEGKHVILGPKEDSGIIAITDSVSGKRWGIVVSHESHNHPSQVVPYEGAATGVGGNVRDVVCMGARVIGVLDALRFGDLASEESRAIARQVVEGISGYGNPLGIPNLGGDVQFHSAYNANCLVNVVTLGLIREDEVIHSYAPEDAAKDHYDIILIGKPTDRSGFGGAAFASLTLEEEEKEKNTGAVQEPNPFLERHILASTYSLFDWIAKEGMLGKVSFKDLGAGGVVCSTVEQVADRGFGAEIDLDRVHVAIPNLPPEVIACAETQERFCWICHPDLTQHILQHYNSVWDLPNIAENARASVIGKVIETPVFRLFHQGRIVCEARPLDITCGLQYERPSREKVISIEPPDRGTSDPNAIADSFLRLISDPNNASKNPIFRHYDKNVIGNTLLEAGEADAGVIAPLQNLRSYVHEGEHPGWTLSEEELWTGVAVSCDGNGRYGLLSPYWQGANAVVESIRNIAAVGALPRALTDCLNYGNPEDPEQLWELREGIRGIADAARGIALDGSPIPIISGNVSLYNSTPTGSIPPTAIVSCIGVMADARKALPSAVQNSGSHIVLLGDRKDECGGSAYYACNGLQGGSVPQPDFHEVLRQVTFTHRVITEGLITACHDISDGGLMLALFEMLLPSRRRTPKFGLHLSLANLDHSLPLSSLLFSETGGFLYEIPEKSFARFSAIALEQHMNMIDLGKSNTEASFVIDGICAYPLAELLDLWRMPLENMLGL